MAASSTGNDVEMTLREAGAEQARAAWADALEVSSLSDEQTQEMAAILMQRGALANPLGRLKHRLGVRPAAGEGAALFASRGKVRTPVQSKLITFARSRMPILVWLPQLDREKVFRDCVAGVTVGIIAIPQGMSYAAVAGLPYVYGLYSACIPPLIYGLFGQSRQLAVGPVAVVSLLLQAGLAEVMTEEECPEWFSAGRAAGKLQSKMCPEAYASLATLTAFVAGVLLLVAYWCRLGFIVSFMGHPVTSGYTAGAAIIIMLSQMKPVFGFDIPQSQVIQDSIAAILKNIHKTNGWTLGLSITWLVFLLTCRRVGKTWKQLSLVGAFAPFASCLIGIALLACWPEVATQHHIDFVGKLPRGIMPFMLPHWDVTAVWRVLPTALTICYVGYIEAIAIGKAMAAKNNYYVEPSQELLTLGMCNLIGAMFGSYPVTGSFSRSAVKLDLNAMTQLSSVMTSLVLWCAILFLTTAFYWLPKFVLSAVVVSCVMPLCDFQEAWHIYRVSRLDGFLWALAFLGVLLLGVDVGIGLAVAASLAVVVHESARPQLSILWRLPGTALYSSVKQESRGSFVEGVLIVRLGASLYFANAQYVKDTLAAYLGDVQEVHRTRYLVLEMTPVISMDVTAAAVLRTFLRELRSRGVELAFVTVGNRLVKTLRTSGLEEEVGREWFFRTVHDAVLHCLRHDRSKPQADDEEARRSGVVSSDNGANSDIGFSNSFHPTYTALFISLPVERPTILSGVTAALERHAVAVVRAQIEATPSAGTQHAYLIQKPGGGKLADAEMEALRGDIATTLWEGVW